MAAAVAYSDSWNIKVCFTGAFYAPGHSESDTTINLKAALSFAATQDAQIGVYVAFRAAQLDDAVKIIRGEDIKPMMFDSQTFGSVYENIALGAPSNTGLRETPVQHKTKPILAHQNLPSHLDIQQAQANIACIALYPGVDKQLLEAVSHKRKILIIDAYHSGTGPADAEERELAEFIAACSGKTKVLVGTLPRKFIDRPYDSTHELKKSGAHVYADLPHHVLYVYSILSLSISTKVKNIITALEPWEV
ncbi:MAG: asparaginase [Pseudomonadales bacterium]|nr:asparaginase [Pseudomonadales bacterium]